MDIELQPLEFQQAKIEAWMQNGNYRLLESYCSGNTLFIKINEDTGKAQIKEIECTLCPKKGSMVWCLNCMDVVYCSSICAALGWAIHKTQCKPYKFPRLRDFCISTKI